MRNLVEIRFGLAASDPRLQATHGPDVRGVTGMEKVVARLDLQFHTHRNPIVGGDNQFRSAKMRRRHSDDSERIAVDFDLFSHGIRISRKAALPQTMADHHYRISTRLVSFRR